MSARHEQPLVDLGELHVALLDRLEPLAEALLGVRNKARSSHREWRWGSQGSLALVIGGAKRGAWRDHETGEGGGPLNLIRRERGGSLADAIRWGADWTGLAGANDADREQDAGRAEQRRRDRARRMAAAEAEEAADRRRRTAWAEELARRSVPLAGTLGERYLIKTRGIALPLNGWPDDAVRWLPVESVSLVEEGPNGTELRRAYKTAGAVVLVATTPRGELSAVQLVYLTWDAENLRRNDAKRSKVKITHGVAGGAAVRLPAIIRQDTWPVGNSVLLLAEGPETGLSLWAATQYETHVALGAMSNHRPTPGRHLVLCRDDDPPYSPADKALRRLVAGWRNDGIKTAVATPWPARRGNRSDFNDTMREIGADAVRARIEEALNPGESKPPPRLPVHEARHKLDKTIGAFFHDALVWGETVTPMEDVPLPSSEGDDHAAGGGEARGREHDAAEISPPPTHPIRLVRTDMGTGKSRSARRHAALTLVRMREAGDRRTIAVAVPLHRLAEEQAEAFRDLETAQAGGLAVGIWRGRAAENPDDAGRRMCRDLDAVHEAQALMLDVRKFACAYCAHQETCAAIGYLAQQNRRADLWLVPHQLLFERKPSALHKLAAVVVDENPVRPALDSANHPVGLPIEVLQRIDSVTDDLSGIATQRLVHLRRRLHDALVGAPDGPLDRAALLTAGLTADMAAEAHALEWQTRIVPPIATMPTKDERREEALAMAKLNVDLGRRATLWHCIRALLAENGPAASGWAALVTTGEEDAGEPVRDVIMAPRRELKTLWRVPTLVLDATASLELLRYIWPSIVQAADIRVTAPYQRIRQVTDRGYALSMLDFEAVYTEDEGAHRWRNMRRMHAVICREARRFAPARVLVAAQDRVERTIADRNMIGPLPGNIELVHHNGTRGIDRWRNVRAVIVIGRTLPSHSAAVRLAEILTGAAIHAEPYILGEGWRELAGGGMERCETWRHPHAIVEAIRWQACEAELGPVLN